MIMWMDIYDFLLLICVYFGDIVGIRVGISGDLG